MASSKTKRRTGRIVLFAIGPLVLALYGGYHYATGGRYIETENAYVKFDILPVSANVEGRVVEVAVGQNRRVGKGGDPVQDRRPAVSHSRQRRQGRT